jgi:thiol-disulfide isomerase/thioredoxin
MTRLRALLQHLRRWRLDIVLVLVLVGGIHLYRTQDMLNADDEPAPPLSLPSIRGNAGGLDAGRDRPAVVYFFAPWCHVCAASAHNLKNLRRLRDEDELQIMLVALDWQTEAEVQAYVERHELDADVLLGSPDTAKDWGISYFPTYYIVDSRQRVVHRDYGYSTLLGLWVRSILAG